MNFFLQFWVRKNVWKFQLKKEKDKVKKKEGERECNC